MLSCGFSKNRENHLHTQRPCTGNLPYLTIPDFPYQIVSGEGANLITVRSLPIVSLEAFCH